MTAVNVLSPVFTYVLSLCLFCLIVDIIVATCAGFLVSEPVIAGPDYQGTVPHFGLFIATISVISLRVMSILMIGFLRLLPFCCSNRRNILICLFKPCCTTRKKHEWKKYIYCRHIDIDTGEVIEETNLPPDNDSVYSSEYSMSVTRLLCISNLVIFILCFVGMVMYMKGIDVLQADGSKSPIQKYIPKIFAIETVLQLILTALIIMLESRKFQHYKNKIQKWAFQENEEENDNKKSVEQNTIVITSTN